MTITTSDTAQRLTFPEDRIAFIYQKPGEPILTPFRSGLQIYLDEAATTLADIRTLDGGPITFSTVYVGDDSLVPLFLGPTSFVRELWAKVIGGTDQTYQLFPQYSNVFELVPTLLHGNGPPTADLGVPGCSYIDELAQILYGPKSADGWPSSGIGLKGDQGTSGGDYTHTQLSADTTWVIDHPLSFRPNVTILDSAGTQVFGDIAYPQPGRVIAEFSSAFGGTALLS